MWRKAELVSELINRLLSAQELAGDTRLFFKDLERDLTHPLYPEIAVIWDRGQPSTAVPQRCRSRLQPARTTCSRIRRQWRDQRQSGGRQRLRV